MMKCLFCLLVVAAPLPEKKPDDDKAKLQGTWNIVGFEQDGKPSNDVKVKSLTFQGDKVTVSPDDPPNPGTFKLDATQKLPTIDITVDDGKLTLKMLYQLDGDTLKLYGAKSEKGDRPKSYEEAGTIISLKREKK